MFYADTDKMGQVYYGNYLKWFEVGRAEWFRTLGMSYRELEEKGYFLPVIEAYCKYLQPAYYDDIISIETDFSMPSSARIRFDYNIYKDTELIAQGYTVHVFLNGSTRKPTKPPAFFREMVKNL